MDVLAALYRISSLMSSPDERLVITTSRLGKNLGVSQQTVSRYLMKLEAEGFITRRSTGVGQKISLTQKSIKSLREMRTGLKTFLSEKPLVVEGAVVSGFEEGAYYIQQYKEIENKIGFRPFPGTLNIKVEVQTDLRRYATITIPSFKMGDRTFGEIKLFPVELHGNRRRVDCYLILPERTHHEGVLEIISKDNLRKKLGLKDGDVIRVRIK